jgi:amidophosphoribosyltransferase
MGKREKGFQTEYIFASENTMFNSLGFEYVRDLEPGEVVYIDHHRQIHAKRAVKAERRPCVFEYVYFARPDSMLDRVSVYRARLRMGQNLARKIKRLHPNLPIDVVIPAPSTANTAALSCAHELGVRYTEGLVKNQFVGRTFIMPGQEIRRKSVRQKLSPIDLEIKNKNVLVIDDSIVRGNTSQQIVSLVRDFGANAVYFAVTAPPLRWPCLYGIDLPTRGEYIANNMNEEEIRKSIGADVLVYQDLSDLVEAVTRKGDHKIKSPCLACFDGNYPTKDVDEAILKRIEEERLADKSKDREIDQNERMMF